MPLIERVPAKLANMAAPLRKFCMCGLTIFQNGVVFPEIISSSIYRAFRTYFNLIGNHVATKERAYDCGLHRWTEVQHSRVLSVSPSGSRTVEKAFPLRRKIKTLNNMISTHIMSRKNIQLHHSGFITLDFSCACRNFTLSTRNTCNSDRADDAACSSQREQERGIQSTKAKRSSVEVDLNESIKPKVIGNHTRSFQYILMNLMNDLSSVCKYLYIFSLISLPPPTHHSHSTHNRSFTL